MGMVKKSISVTEQQNSWIKAQIQTGHFGNESEVIRELIRERQLREHVRDDAGNASMATTDRYIERDQRERHYSGQKKPVKVFE